MSMRITFDKEADAAYICTEQKINFSSVSSSSKKQKLDDFKEISPGEVNKTISLNESVNIDLDSQGKTLGIEIINASKNLPVSALNSAVLI